MKKILGIATVAMLMVVGVQAQTIISNFSPITQNFNAYTGTATLPTDWSTNWTDFNPGGFYNRNTAYTNSNSAYALRDSATSSDIALGGKMGASEGPFNFTWALTNSTGQTLNGFTLAWDIEQYSGGFRATTVNFAYSIGAGPYSTTGVTGTTLTTASLGATDGVQLASITTTSRSINVSGLTLNNGDNLNLRYILTTGAGSGGNAHIGIDNVSFTAIPEPSTYALLGLGLGALWFLRRKKPAAKA